MSYETPINVIASGYNEDRPVGNINHGVVVQSAAGAIDISKAVTVFNAASAKAVTLADSVEGKQIELLNKGAGTITATPTNFGGGTTIVLLEGQSTKLVFVMGQWEVLKYNIAGVIRHSIAGAIDYSQPVVVFTAAAGIAASLPDAPVGTVLELVNQGVGTVTITPAHFEDGATLALTTDESARLVFVGTSWKKITSDGTIA